MKKPTKNTKSAPAQIILPLGNSNSFNFEVWAVAVKQQMVAALHKKEFC
jgi:hypothetical protein